MSIQVNNLLKKYGEQIAVNNISFQVGKGEIVGFLGPNGAGKSTSMKIMTGFLQQDAGEAIICGIDINKDPLSVKRKIGYLPESNALYYDMYIREYLAFIAELHALNGQSKNRINEVIELTGLGLESKKKIGQLSKGYKQRVGLAAALIHDPEVLILDEPTSGLDPNQIIEIRDVIKRQGENKTVLFSSHILQEVEAICNRVIIINKGTIVADDTLNELRNRKSGNFIQVSFKEEIEGSIIQNLSSVLTLKKTDHSSWQIETNDTDLARKQIMELVIEKNLSLVSLQNEGSNLEGIFRELTNY
jgi:ABC-2 type transport system ATP-binding protein